MPSCCIVANHSENLATFLIDGTESCPSRKRGDPCLLTALLQVRDNFGCADALPLFACAFLDNSVCHFKHPTRSPVTLLDHQAHSAAVERHEVVAPTIGGAKAVHVCDEQLFAFTYFLDRVEDHGDALVLFAMNVPIAARIGVEAASCFSN